MKFLHRFAPLAALVLVNTFAVIGQYGWAYINLGSDRIIAAGFAATLESISLFLTNEASKAMLANDRAGALRAGAYLVGLLVGAMNYQAHAGPNWHPTAMAIAFGLLSALSPWLWTIWTRGKHRAQLRAEGLIDPRAVKLPGMLWVLYPRQAVRMLRLAVWNGENRPAQVRVMFAERAALRGLSGVEQVRYAHGALGHYEPHAARVWLQQRGVLVNQAALDAAAPVRMPAAAPVSPAPAMATTAAPAELTAGANLAGAEYHRAQLAGLPSKRAKMRYAYTTLGDVTAGAVVRWLAELGYPVARSEAAAVRSALDTPTGEHPTIGAGGQLVPWLDSVREAATAGALVRVNGHHPAN